MDYKEYRRMRGLCARCGKEPYAVNSTWYCADCMQKNAESSHRWYENLTPEQKTAMVTKTREWRKKRREMGMCTNCKNPARPGKALCVECAIRTSRQRKEKRRREKIENENKANSSR